MTAPNSDAVRRCLRSAIDSSGIHPNEIDLINGHLTATVKDTTEVENWMHTLQRSGKNFPYIQSLKSMVGHCLAAAGSIESVAAIIQLKEGFIFPTINCEDIHPEIERLIDSAKISDKAIKKELNIVVKASFGFGDVNACILLKKYQ